HTCPPSVVIAFDRTVSFLRSPRMFTRTSLRPGRWITLVLSGLGVVTAISFSRAANTVTFQPGMAIPIRGVPMNQRPVGNSFTLPGGLVFGGFPQPVQVMPSRPNNPGGFGQQPTPQFNTLGGAGAAGGGAGGIGGAGGGIGGISGGISGGI